MPTLTFYQQARVDGGVRTGIDFDGSPLLQEFQPESDDFDPALLWYLDLRCQGDSLPTEPEQARQWFGERSKLIQSELNVAADEVALGFDAQPHPWSKVTRLAEGVDLRIVASAIRRLEARELAGRMRQIANGWEVILRRLAPLSHV